MPAPKDPKRYEEWRKEQAERMRGNIPWNKGKQLVAELRDSKFHRKDPNYYLNELKENSERNHAKGYDMKRMPEIIAANKARVERCGIHGRQEWKDWELEYLVDHYKTMTNEAIAKHLKRSYSSITHKLNRMGLKKNHKWKE